MATGSGHEGRKLCDLRVVDLRSELEKRGLDKTGVKITLVERLQQVIIEEGHDPEEYVFDNKGPSQRLSTSSKQDDMESMDADNSQEQDSALDVDPEDLLVKDEINDESLNDEEETEGPNMLCDEKIVIVKDVKPLKVVEIKVANCRAVAKSRPGPASAKRKAAAAAAAIAVSPIAPESNAGENEDSINLTIGEEEEKLLQEEDMGGAAKKVKIDETMLQETSVDDLDKTELLDNCVEEEPVEDNPLSTTTGKTTTQESSNSLKNEDTKNEPAADVSSTSEDIAASSATAPGKGVSKDDKDASAKQSAVNTQASRNLWVSGLASSTRATDLKQVFSKHGKVIGAKVVTNAKAPGSRCYGYITMATSEDASKCIHRLNRTELHGRIISLEKAKSDATNPPKKSDNVTVKKSDDKKIAKEASTKKESEKKSVEKVVEVKTDPVEKVNESNGPVKTSESEKKVESLVGNKEEEQETVKNKPVSVTDKSETKKNSKSQNREKSPIRGKKRQPRIIKERQRDKKMEVLSFNKIREERERQRLRERQRALREEERRGREELARAREIERRQREEAQRLAREREKLQTEREKIEREKAALMRAERERQKMERERLEYEKMELKRQQIKIEEAHRAALKRPVADRRMDNYVDDRKRLAVPERRFEAPPPPRFDSAITGRSAYEPDISNKKDFKRDDFKRSGADDFKRDSFKRGGADDFKRPDFKRDFDIAPRNTAPANHSSHAVNQGGTSGGSKMMKYPSPAYDSRRDTRDTGRHAMDVTPTRREGGGPMASLVVPRGKDSRYPVRGAERTTERGGTGVGSQPFRGGRGDDRDARHVEPEHRSGKVDPRGSGPTRDRYVDSSKGRDSGRYADRSASSWHGGSSSGVKPFGSTNSSGTAPGGGGSGVRGDNWNKPADPWRQIDSGSNDRYDRTYNERKVPGNNARQQPVFNKPGVGNNFGNRNNNSFGDRNGPRPLMDSTAVISRGPVRYPVEGGQQYGGRPANY